MTATLEDTQRFPWSRAIAVSDRMAAGLETVAVLASPPVLYALERLRGMGPPQLPDPAMHTTYILNAHDIFLRYQDVFEPSARLREAARVGFLVPARLTYLLFGAVPGFFVLRYLLALVAIVPLYLLLKKLYGRWAGFVGIAVVMSSPVVVTAWGTDYPDSATISYLTGGLAALALSWEATRRRLGWLGLAGALLTMAVWSLGIAMPLVVAVLVAYLAVRVARRRASLLRDLALLAASAVGVTALLAVGSKLFLGQFDFITPTVDSARFLTRASELRNNHSASWSWAQYDPYLLVPPAIAAAFVAVFARRWRKIGITPLFVGVAGLLQVAVCFYLQFLGSLQILEMHYFSSTLWGAVNVMLAFAVAEVARPIVGMGARGPTPRPQLLGWIVAAVPALLVLGAALGYEAAYKADLHVSPMTWAPWGVIIAAIVIAAAVVGRVGIDWARPLRDGVGTAARFAATRLLPAAAVLAMTGAALVLTVAPATPHAPLKNTVYDPFPPYAKALGGNDSAYVAEYRVISQLPGFVGHAAYRRERLLTWEPRSQFGDLLGPMGIYHNAITWVSETFPVLSPNGVRKIQGWRAAQVLLMSLTGQGFDQAVRSLARFQPVVARRGVISHGWYHLHVWLIDLGRYIRRK